MKASATLAPELIVLCVGFPPPSFLCFMFSFIHVIYRGIIVQARRFPAPPTILDYTFLLLLVHASI